MRPKTPNRRPRLARDRYTHRRLTAAGAQGRQEDRTTELTALDTQPRTGHRQSQHPGGKPGAPTRQTVAARQTLDPGPNATRRRSAVRYGSRTLPGKLCSRRPRSRSCSQQRASAPRRKPHPARGHRARRRMHTNHHPAIRTIPAPATIEVNDETDPDCHTPGIIYQQADDTVIDATVETTGTDWATRCRALGKTVGPLAVGTRAGTSHTRSRRPPARARSAAQHPVASRSPWWHSTTDDATETVFDCRKGGAHITPPAGDGHAHEWLDRTVGTLAMDRNGAPGKYQQQQLPARYTEFRPDRLPAVRRGRPRRDRTQRAQTRETEYHKGPHRTRLR